MRNATDKDIGLKILKIMRDRGIKQVQLAEACEVAPSFLNRALHGSKHIPDDLLEKVTAALQIDFDELDDCCTGCDQDSLTKAMIETFKKLKSYQSIKIKVCNYYVKRK